jgi:RND superfamily putative drug exporter
MLTRLANLGLGHPRRVIGVALAFFLVAGVIGGPAAGLLKARNGFQDPGSQAAQAQRLIQRATGAEAHPGVLALVSAAPGTPAVASAAVTLRTVSGVASVATPTGRHDPALVSRDGRSSMVAATLRSAPNPNDVVKRIEAAFKGRHDVRLGGTDVANEQVVAQANSDLALAELLAFPLLAVLALVIFRGVAAVLPLAVGGTSVLGTFVVLRAVNAALPLSAFALNLVIGLGLGLAIDYSLFLVWRFREEVGRGAAVGDALRVTMATAGRTVIFSALTVAAAMATLIVFPQRFLVSMGIGGAVVALVAAAAALLVLPAAFVLLGSRLGRVHPRPLGTGGWYSLAHAVMRRPGLVAAGTAAALLVVASPTLRTHWSGVDATVLPTSRSARVVSDTLARSFSAQDLNTVTIAASAPGSDRRPLATYAARLGAVPGVTSVRPSEYLGNGVWKLTLGAAGDPISAGAQHTIAQVRAQPAPVPVAVGGQAADFHDQRAAISSSLPLALAVLGAVTLLILWAMTGSVVLPVKTLLMNALTVVTATGLLVFVFQDGRLTGPLAYTSQGGIEQTDFLVLAALVFALSTDYGVFLLTRIREARARGLPDREAIAAGLERTGRLVTAAAILLAVAIGAFGTSKVVFLKEVGLGTAAAVLIDAFVVRTLLVPSLMALLGRRNWWAPAPLRRLHERLGLGETDGAAMVAQPRRELGDRHAPRPLPAIANQGDRS